MQNFQTQSSSLSVPMCTHASACRAAAPPLLRPYSQETAAKIKAACAATGATDVSPNTIAYYTVLLHALDPSAPAMEPGQFRAASRELLLPGTPVYTPESECSCWHQCLCIVLKTHCIVFQTHCSALSPLHTLLVPVPAAQCLCSAVEEQVSKTS